MQACACLIDLCRLAVDVRVRPLVMFVKHWAKFQNINDASQGTISSYSLALMVINYLQCKLFGSVFSYAVSLSGAIRIGPFPFPG